MQWSSFYWLLTQQVIRTEFATQVSSLNLIRNIVF